MDICTVFAVNLNRCTLVASAGFVPAFLSNKTKHVLCLMSFPCKHTKSMSVYCSSVIAFVARTLLVYYPYIGIITKLRNKKHTHIASRTHDLRASIRKMVNIDDFSRMVNDGSQSQMWLMRQFSGHFLWWLVKLINQPTAITFTDAFEVGKLMFGDSLGRY